MLAIVEEVELGMRLHRHMHMQLGVGGISVYLVNFGVYWILNIIGR